MTLVFSLVAASALAADGKFDGRAWKVGYDAGNSQEHVTEYVIDPETVDNWTELVTNQVIKDPGHKFELQKMAELMKSGFGSDCKNFKWTVLDSSDKRILIEWTHEGCDGFPPQWEVDSLSLCEEGICRWAYVTKHTPPTEATRDQWKAIIRGF